MTLSTDRLLPAGFEVLEPFVPAWALAEESARMRKRWSSSMDEIRGFYEAMVPHVERALDYLDGFELETLPPTERRLLHLALSLVEVANAVEVYLQPAPFNALPPDRFVPVDRI